RPLVHGQAGHIVTVELDASAIGRDEAGNHVEDGGFSRPVWAEQADGLAAPHVDAYALHHLASDEALFNAGRGEKAVTLRSPHRPLATACARLGGDRLGRFGAGGGPAGRTVIKGGLSRGGLRRRFAAYRLASQQSENIEYPRRQGSIAPLLFVQFQ